MIRNQSVHLVLSPRVHLAKQNSFFRHFIQETRKKTQKQNLPS